MQGSRFFIFLCLSLLPWLVHAQKEVQKRLQTQFITANDGDTIRIAAGTFVLDGTLWMDSKKDVVIRGAGKAQTVLSFKGQTSGAEGLKITNCQRITIEGLTVLDAKGDAIKVQLTDGIVFRDTKTAWSGKPKPTNGAYGFYPVNCDNVLIEHCEATGASDAGIYVGQSRNIIVRHCKAWNNVAGIEIENSLYADVHDNESWSNTGGLLVFDLPDLVQKKGGYVRLFHNNVHDNNLSNFAPKGNIVAKVPQGTGLLILATNHVEVFENQFINNNSVSAGIMSYYITEIPIKDSLYYPYPDHITIYQNIFKRAHVRATGKGRMGQMFRFKLRFGKDVPHILYDGILDSKATSGRANICIWENEEHSFVNLDAEHDFKGMTRDMANVNCKLPSLKPVTLNLSPKP